MDKFIGILIRCIVWLAKYTAILAKLGIGEYEKWQKGEKIKFLLVGYNGVRNTGADARVVSIVEQIENVFGMDHVQISVMTLDQKTMYGYFNEHVKMIPFSTIFLGDIYRECSRHHVAILCEGSTLKSTFANALTMCFCEVAGIMKSQHKPCIAYGSEVGDMDNYLRKMARDLCAETYFIVRTEDSYRKLAELGLRGHIGTDTAWNFQSRDKYVWAKEKMISSGWDGEQPVLGIAVINPFCWPVKSSLVRWLMAGLNHDWSLQYNKWYFFSYSKERKAMYQRYIKQIAEAVNRFCANKNYHVAVIGMERLDTNACGKLADRLNQSCSVFTSSEYDVFEMNAVLSHLSCLITSRYHAAVLSMRKAIPITAVSMDERLDSIMKELTIHESFLYSVRDVDLGKYIYESLINMEENKADIQNLIMKKKTYYDQTLHQMGEFLKKYIFEMLQVNG